MKLSLTPIFALSLLTTSIDAYEFKTGSGVCAKRYEKCTEPWVYLCECNSGWIVSLPYLIRGCARAYCYQYRCSVVVAGPASIQPL